MCQTDQIVVRSETGEMMTIDMMHENKQSLQETTVLQLKKTAVKKFPRLSGQSVGDVKLIHDAKPLDKDSAPLSEYGVKPESVVQIVRKVNGG